MDNYDILWHNSAIEFVILILIVGLYKSNWIPKEYMTICLLGSYITLKGIFGVIHWGGHKMLHNCKNKIN